MPKITANLLVDAINSIIEPQHTKESRNFIIVINDVVVPCVLTKEEYIAETKRIATSGAKVELYTLSGELTTNLDVTINTIASSTDVVKTIGE